MPGSSRTKVLAIGMFDSVHFSGWLRHFRDEQIEFVLFPSSPHRRLHPGLIELLENEGAASFSLAIGTRYLGLPMWILDKALSNRLRSTFVRILISRLKPAIVHALELQNAGYIASRALGHLKRKKPIFVATNYGSDIYWFSRFPKHLSSLSKLLVQVDRYAAECERDIKLAQELGFTKEVMPVLPNAGGFRVEQLAGDLLPPEDRRLIMIKGYQGWVGRAHIGLQAIESMASELRNFEIVVYSCNLSTKRLAAQIARRTQLKIKAFSKGALGHDEMVDKFSNSLIYVGLSLSDGISTSMLEAMAMGAIPVQTATSCCKEWFDDTGVAIETLDIAEVQTGIRTAIEMALSTNSAIRNRETIRIRASRQEIAKQARSFYAL